MLNVFRIILLLHIVLFKLISVVHCQELFINDMERYRKVSKREIIKSFMSTKLDSKYLQDSVETYFWKNYYWYLRISEPEEDEFYSELYAYDKKSGKSIQVTNHQISNYSSTIDAICFFNDQMFIGTTKLVDKDTMCNRLLIVDSKNMRISKEICFASNSYIEKEYIHNNMLHYEVQPIKYELNYSYYLLFWMRDGAPPKWEMKKNGNRRLYVFNETFELIKNQELK